MSVGINNAALPEKTTEINAISNANKTNEKSGILDKVLNKLAEGRDFIFKALKGKSGALITLGQVGGVAAMTAGGLSLAFTGLAASLTVGGIPLGIPLIAGGAVLFTAGTGLLIAKLAMTVKSTLGEKIKEFFNVTGKNIALGLGLGALGAGVFSQVTPGVLVAAAPVVVQKLKEVNEKKEEIFGYMGQGLEVLDKINEVVQPGLANMDKAEKKEASNGEDVKTIEKSATLSQIQKKDIETSDKITDKNRMVEQNQMKPTSETMNKELEKKALEGMRFFMAYYLANN